MDAQTVTLNYLEKCGFEIREQVIIPPNRELSDTEEDAITMLKRQHGWIVSKKDYNISL